MQAEYPYQGFMYDASDEGEEEALANDAGKRLMLQVNVGCYR